MTLDQSSFRALASEVRVGILRKLDERRATVTDLSSLMDLSKPTLLEHLEKLLAAGLVKRVDEGRKWIYYELTQKGRRILHPEKVTIVVSLSLAVLLGVGGVVALVAGFSSGILMAPGTGPGGALASNAATLSAPLLVGFSLIAAGLWFVAVSLYFKVRGDRRKLELFDSLANL